MFTAQAQVKSERAAAYLAQLCKHFSHKARAQHDGDQGAVDFQPGLCRMHASGHELTLKCEADCEQTLAHIKAIVGDHLVRFAWREGIAVTWTDAA